MNNQIIKEVLKNLPKDSLSQLLAAVQYEMLQRDSAGHETSYESLVDRFGIDGQKQMPQSGDVVRQGERYLMGDIPFTMSFDNDTNCFVYTPKGPMLTLLISAFSKSYVHQSIRDIANENIEIHIDPMLFKDDVIHLHNFVEDRTVPLAETLEQLVNWYRLQDKIDINDVPYVGGCNSEDVIDEFVLGEYKDNQMARSVDWRGYTFKSAPFRVGTAINVQALSNVGLLIMEGAIAGTTKLEPLPNVTSVFVDVGGYLIRVMTGRIPYSRFAPAQVQGDRNAVLELRAAVNISKGHKDCFGNNIPWTELLGEEGIDLEIRLNGSFNNGVGVMATGNGKVDFFAHDEIGSTLKELLLPTSKCVAFDIDAKLV